MSNKENKDWEPYYSVLGEFVVTFENIVFTIREDCSFLLEYKGLKDPVLADIVFGQKYLSADPLVNCYVSMVNHIIGQNEKEDIKIRLSQFKNKFIKLITLRNEIVHATHFLEETRSFFSPRTVETEFIAYKTSPNQNGYNLKSVTRPRIIKSTEQLKALKKEFDMFVKDFHSFLKESK